MVKVEARGGRRNGGETAGPPAKGRSRPARKPWMPLIAVAAILLMVDWTALGGVSGQFGLDVTVRRIPSTLSGDIVLDTPTEFAELEFGIASDLNLKIDGGFASALVDAVVNMAGPEHLVVLGDLPIKDLNLYGVVIDRLRFVPEVWFAIPFEAVTDVNNLSNSAVIPPGYALFVTGRITSTCTIGGFMLKHVVMLQDVNFPKPGASYTTPPEGEPITYEATDQEFDLGTLLYASWRSQAGYSARATLGLNASQASTSVKGYSAVGSVTPGNWFASGSISGIYLDSLMGATPWLTHAQIGAGFVVSTTQTMSGTLDFSARLAGGMGVGASMGLFANAGSFSGISLSGTVGCFRFAMLLDSMKLTSLSARYNTPLNLGVMKGAFSVSATGLEKGLTGLSTRLSLTQGLFSAATSVAFAQSAERFRFASLSTQLTYRLSPGVISVQATFSRYGLSRAGFGTSVSF
ncbi:MAG: hypothetical protein PHW86_07395 [Candidatus Bipolaricaulis sp.]|nr:hypothetical protein [Candidatus Bipolaricaulis sp.]